MSDSLSVSNSTVWCSDDEKPKPKTAEYIHNNDYAQKLKHQEWLDDEALKARIRSNEKKAKMQKRLAAKEKREKKKKEEFDRVYNKAKAKMMDGLSLTQATAPSSPRSPPKKKKKAVTKKSSKFPPQKNKVTAYFTTPSPPEAKCPPVSADGDSRYPVFNTAPADRVSNFRYPMPLSKPLSVLPYSMMTSTSIYSSYSSYSKDIDSDGNLVDMNKICRGCDNPYMYCMEKMWRKVCLNKVCNYLQDKDFEGVTKEGVKNVYYDTFVLMAKAEILERSDWWELSTNLILPKCMEEGSLEEAYKMMDGLDDLTYEYFTTRRVS